MSTHLVSKYLSGFVKESEILAMQSEVDKAHDLLHSQKGLGNDYLGWLNLPSDYDKDEFLRIKSAAEKIIKNSQVLIVVGIGGSYLGARAAIEFIKSSNYNLLEKDTPNIYFTGNSISSDSLSEIIELCEGKDFSVNVISKSGTTTEPAIAFRVMRKMLMERYGDKAFDRIFVTTDKSKGTLKAFSDTQGYETFVVPDNVGGRYSVLTSVGLLPIAVAGIDIDALMKGAQDAQRDFLNTDLKSNSCYRYAAIRNILYRMGKNIELMVSYEPSFALMNEWLKQLFGESEGKQGKGIFPASAIFSTDLHSLGQYIQQGRRSLFETIVIFDKPKKDMTINSENPDIDGLNFLAGKKMSYVNQKAFEGTVLAHTDGGVPNIVLKS
ncbi:MAG: glucose-6-phosphate isomerase, partial [Oscillospiraceae bacterium]|nr:glucose-6-phosphate isomerase [Oscillospiraceae bacterium]